MAEAAHEAFCESLISQGFQYGQEANSELKTHPALVKYNLLPEDLKEASRANVRDIPRKLHQLGYRIATGGDHDATLNFSDVELERLAQLEHHRWMEHRLESGWSFGPKTDPARKIHASLVVWDELFEEEREKDRAMVRSIPKILAAAGYLLVADQNRFGSE